MLYTFGRLFLGTSVWIRTVTCPSNHLIIKLLGLSLILQSFFYIYRMVFILKQRTAEYSERKRKGIKMQWFAPLSKEEIAKVDLYSAKNRPKVP